MSTLIEIATDKSGRVKNRISAYKSILKKLEKEEEKTDLNVLTRKLSEELKDTNQNIVIEILKILLIVFNSKDTNLTKEAEPLLPRLIGKLDT